MAGVKQTVWRLDRCLELAAQPWRRSGSRPPLHNFLPAVIYMGGARQHGEAAKLRWRKLQTERLKESHRHTPVRNGTVHVASRACRCAGSLPHPRERYLLPVDCRHSQVAVWRRPQCRSCLQRYRVIQPFRTAQLELHLEERRLLLHWAGEGRR